MHVWYIPSSEEIISDGDLVSLEHELVDEVRTDESAAASDQDSLSILVIEKFHRRISRSRVATIEIWGKKQNCMFDLFNQDNCLFKLNCTHLHLLADSSNSSLYPTLSAVGLSSSRASALPAPSPHPSRRCRPRRRRRGPTRRRTRTTKTLRPSFAESSFPMANTTLFVVM